MSFTPPSDVPPTPAVAPPGSERAVRIGCLVGIGLIVLCGLCGTAFFVLNLLIPFFQTSS